ncbi:ABC transporter ATP-binding protein [Chloroflexota bacterium]
MPPAVSCVDVSKQYRLGVTRTSLLRVLSNSIKRTIKRDSQQVHRDKTIWALREINFDLSQGESLGIIGPNGAGKSTLLKLLAKVTRPTSGEINVPGRLSALIELGSGFHGDLTGRENIYLNGTILGLSRQEINRRFDEIVDFSGIEQFIETPIKRYSSGMLVRLGFAVAACIDTDILLVDEVLAVGDASFRQKCTARIQSLLEDGTSLIFVSHNLYMVNAICKRTMYLNKGIMKVQGNTTDVIKRYEHDLHEEDAQKFDIEQAKSIPQFVNAQIEDIEILNADSTEGQSEFTSDQNVEIRIHYRAFTGSRKANFTIRIIRSDGVTCCNMRTTNDQVEFCLNEGKGYVAATLEPLQLAGGSYHVEAEITNEDECVLVAVGHSDWFIVTGRSLSHEMNSGIFEPARIWSHSNQK